MWLNWRERNERIKGDFYSSLWKEKFKFVETVRERRIFNRISRIIYFSHKMYYFIFLSKEGIILVITSL